MELKQLEKQLPKQIKTVWRQVYSITGSLLLLVSAGLLAIFYYAEINLAFSLIGFLITLAYFFILFSFFLFLLGGKDGVIKFDTTKLKFNTALFLGVVF